jgi:DNA modification methylase
MKFKIETERRENFVELIQYLIRTYSKENELILDNTSGSGTLAVAAELENRKWICIEKEQEYCDITIKRLQELHNNQI